jgi:hypothetical protein
MGSILLSILWVKEWDYEPLTILEQKKPGKQSPSPAKSELFRFLIQHQAKSSAMNSLSWLADSPIKPFATAAIGLSHSHTTLLKIIVFLSKWATHDIG